MNIVFVLPFNDFSFFFIRQEKVIFPTLFMGNSICLLCSLICLTDALWWKIH